MVIWSELQASPLVWLALTLIAYLIASWLNLKARRTPFMHPVLLSLTLIILVLLATDTPYDVYLEGARFIHFLMGPAIVALAVPLYDNLGRVRALLGPLLLATVLGALTAAITAIAVGMALGLSGPTLLSLAPKSVTTPIAIGVAEKLGGYPSLAAGLVLITGALGCLFAPLIYRLLRIRDEAIKGYTLGVAAHAMGTAYAFEYGAVAGAFSGLAMGLTGAFTAFVLPLLLSLLGIG